ncbi:MULTISPECIES: ABC transporter permease [Undibacterium]|uniref:Transport permease protein n=1 Tax=Undibacterium umbellatum TaxID=2762300 RepID=A0ABR6ZG33_9BURK|nr:MULTISPECIES: ABC transporter permease [Undibacterium]MBC3910336.1 ABC transporter permease [Undibacterium umbellatum]MDP1980816.1 ABC transporter permease [Undibacterium sp.]
MKAVLISLWHYRHFIVSSIKAEFSGRFARSKLGALWMILNPLAQATIFAIVLSEVLVTKIPNIENKSAYAIYLMAGMSAWGLFAEIMNRCTTVFIDYSNTLKKISFPRLCLPLIVGGSALINHLLLLAAIAVVFLFFGHMPTIAWLALPFGMLLIVLLAFGLGIILGLLNVFSRDVGQVMGIVLQLWFWFTPVVYLMDNMPPRFIAVLKLNPMTPMVKIYQNALLYGQFPALADLLIPTLISSGLFLFSFWIFRRASADLVDAL